MAALYFAAALVFATFLTYGLVSGRMPTRGRPFERNQDPRAYWIMGSFWAVFTVAFIWKAWVIWRH